jgi:hypothetical protein
MNQRVPLVIRGDVIEEYECEFGTCAAATRFTTPDVTAHLTRLPLAAAAMSDLLSLRLADVVEFLDSLGRRLVSAENPYLQAAFEMSRKTSMLSDAVLRDLYEKLPLLFCREMVEHRTRCLLGADYPDRWTELPALAGSRVRARMRPFGARTIHIVAGNTPAIGPLTIANNAITLGDAIIKSPSNDPLTSVAVARTMIEMAPDHPLTRHLTVAYWKGGDTRVERFLYDPRRIEKIVAWGGVGSIRHVLGGLQPGIDLITLDPKQGLGIIEAAALASQENLAEAAARLALDIGAMDQEACFSTRLVFLVGHGDAGDLSLARQLAQLTFEHLQHLPQSVSGPHKAFDPELKAELDGLRLCDFGDYDLFGGRRNEGAVIVSRTGKPVDFAHRLACRVANIVPVSSVEAALAPIGSWAQTVTIYPESFKNALRDRLACHGAQRIVSLGEATIDPRVAAPQDGMELLPRMCKWVVEETPLDR